MTNKANELREQAREHRTAARESFDRCDTDGFVSQWAHGINARLADRQAEIEERGGVWDFPRLFEVESGRQVDAKKIPSKFGGFVWLLSDEETDRFGRRFIPTDGSHMDDEDWKYSRSRVQKNLGLEQRLTELPAFAKIAANGTGLAGAASATVIVIEKTW